MDTQTYLNLPKRHRSSLCTLWVFSLIVLLYHIDPYNAKAQSQPTEYGLKAAFLLNFAAYTQWPLTAFNTDDAPINFGIIGAEELAANLEQIATSRNINGRAIKVIRLEENNLPENLNILFVGRLYDMDSDELLDEALSRSILTVTETEFSRAEGSIINFELNDNRVSFDVSMQAAQTANLIISSRMLQVAQRIID